MAILLVVAAHAGVAMFGGGFVGVDVFFVLSGYLITGVLVQEIQKTGRIRFGTFYARRFRRLLPALLVMLAFTSLAGRLLLAPGEQPGQALSAASAALWLSNLRFTFADLDYFSPGVETDLYLHTWSLGVEEQFYLFWPALTLLTIGLARSSARRENLDRLRIVMIALFVVSLVACFRLTDSAPQAAFYLMPTRAWQFALGALVFISFGSAALAHSGLDLRPRSRTGMGLARAWCGWLGIAMIVGSAIYLDRDMPYPGSFALLPSVGAAAVLAAGVNSAKAGVGRLLSLAPMQAMGRVSYSWYLWHWPVLLLGGRFATSMTWPYRLASVAASLGIAAASYRFLEAPIRRDERWLEQPGFTVVASVVAMVALGALAVAWQRTALDRLAQPDVRTGESLRADIPAIYEMGCDDFYRSDRVRICSFGSRTAQHTAVAMGDSIGMQWFPAMEETFTKPGWRLLVITKSSCPMVDQPYFLDRIGREFTECATWRGEALRQVRALSPEVLVLGSSVNYGFTKDEWVEGTDRILKSLSGSAQRISILRPTPVLPFDAPSCLAASESPVRRYLSDANRCTAPATDAAGNQVHRWLRQVALRFPNVSVVDMNDIVCPSNLCRAERDGVVVFRDSRHLTATYVRSISEPFAVRVRPNL